LLGSDVFAAITAIVALPEGVSSGRFSVLVFVLIVINNMLEL